MSKEPPVFVQRPGGGVASRAAKSSAARRVKVLIALFVLALIYSGLSLLVPPAPPEKLPAPAPLANASIERFHVEYRFDRQGALLVSETISVNKTDEAIEHGISRRLPKALIMGTDEQGQPIKFELDIEVLNRSLLKDTKEISGLEFRPAKEDEQSIRHYIGGENLQLSNGLYTFYFQYKIRNLSELFKQGKAFRWQVMDPWGLELKEFALDLFFPPYVESQHAEISTKIIGFEEYEGGYAGLESKEDLELNKIFPANNPDKDLRLKEIVQVAARTPRVLAPNESVMLNVEIPAAYFITGN